MIGSNLSTCARPSPGGGGWRGGFGGGVREGRLGRMQVNRALHTCTAWNAYGAHVPPPPPPKSPHLDPHPPNRPPER